jgi:hypothetical protein
MAGPLPQPRIISARFWCRLFLEPHRHPQMLRIRHMQTQMAIMPTTKMAATIPQKSIELFVNSHPTGVVSDTAAE